MNKLHTFLALGFILSLLTGCDTAKEALGLKEKQPDAFEVMDRAPLELPPDFSLRPPEPGKKRPQEQSKRDRAKEQILTQSKKRQKNRAGHYKSSHGQKLLLRSAGAHQTQPGLRNKLRAQEHADASDSFLKQLVSNKKKSDTIDPYQEKKNLAHLTS